MSVAALEQRLVGVTHGLGLAATDHHLEVHRLEAIVIIAVDHAGRSRNALPRAKPGRDPAHGFVLDEHVEVALKHEEHLFDLMGMRGIPLPGLDKHDGEREIPSWNDTGVAVLARAAGADEPVLCALEAFDLGVLEASPVCL